MNDTNPALLEGEEFHDWISTHLAYRNDWSSILTHEHVKRTADSVDGLLQLLRDQLDERPEPSDWHKRTWGMKSMAEARLRQCERHIEGGAGAHLWKRFGHQLVELIVTHGSDELVDMLDEVMIPVGGLNAGDWYDRRLEKREGVDAERAKRREAAVVEGINAGYVGDVLVKRVAA